MQISKYHLTDLALALFPLLRSTLPHNQLPLLPIRIRSSAVGLSVPVQAESCRERASVARTCRLLIRDRSRTRSDLAGPALHEEVTWTGHARAKSDYVTPLKIGSKDSCGPHRGPAMDNRVAIEVKKYFKVASATISQTGGSKKWDCLLCKKFGCRVRDLLQIPGPVGPQVRNPGPGPGRSRVRATL